MGCVEVSSIEYSHSFIVLDRQSLEELDEAAFIVDLEECQGVATDGLDVEFTLSSGREDIVVGFHTNLIDLARKQSLRLISRVDLMLQHDQVTLKERAVGDAT